MLTENVYLIDKIEYFQILVANNGLAAMKCLISIRQWLQNQFGTSGVVSFVCIATEDEMRSASRKFFGMFFHLSKLTLLKIISS